MSEPTLRHCRILVVEDEFMLADDLHTELDNAGAIVLGPVATLEKAIDLITREEDIDAAILDVNLRGEMVYPAADLLVRRGTPFVFTTGYDASAIPARFEHAVRCEKPVNITKLAQAIGRVVGDRTSGV